MAAEGGGHDTVLGPMAALEFGGEAAGGEDGDAVAEHHEFVEVGGDDEHGFALGGEVGEEAVDFEASADVDAAGGFVEDEDIAIAEEPAGYDDLLLVAAAEFDDALVGGVAADLEALDPMVQGTGFGAAADPAGGMGEAGEGGDGEIFADTEGEEEAVGFAVFGEQGDAVADGFAGGADWGGGGTAVEEELAGVEAVGAEDGAHGFGAAGAHETGEPEDFAAVRVEVDIADFIAEAEAADGEGDGAAGAAGGEVGAAEFAADHEAHDFVEVHGGDLAGGDEVAVAEHADAVGDEADFLEPMGDVEDGDAFGAETSDLLEEVGDFGGGEGGGGFVEDEHAAAAPEAGGDFDHLLLADAELFDGEAGVEVGHADAAEDFGGVAAEGGEVDPAGAMGEVIEEDVFGDGEGTDEVQLLHDHVDADGFGVLLGAGGVGLALEAEGAAVGGGEAGNDAGEGAFAGTIFADERVNFTGEEVEVDAIEDGGGVGFAQVTDREQGLHGWRGSRLGYGSSRLEWFGVGRLGRMSPGRS